MVEWQELNDTFWPRLPVSQDDCGPQFAPPAGPRERRVLIQHARVVGTPNPGVSAIMSMAQAARYKEKKAPGAKQLSLQTSENSLLAPTLSRRPYYGTTLASMARAAELRAHHNCSVDATGLTPDIAASGVADDSTERMVKRRNWLPLDLSQVTDQDSQRVLDKDTDFTVCEEMQYDQESKLCEILMRVLSQWSFSCYVPRIVDFRYSFGSVTRSRIVLWLIRCAAQPVFSITKSPAFSPPTESQPTSPFMDEKNDTDPSSASTDSTMVQVSDHLNQDEIRTVFPTEYAVVGRPRVSLPPASANSKPPHIIRQSRGLPATSSISSIVLLKKINPDFVKHLMHKQVSPCVRLTIAQSTPLAVDYHIFRHRATCRIQAQIVGVRRGLSTLPEGED